jgi:hypothetical protein
MRGLGWLPAQRTAALLLSGMGCVFHHQAGAAQLNCLQNHDSALGIGFHSGAILPSDHSCRKRDNGLPIM